MEDASGSAPVCPRCKENEATLELRAEQACPACFNQYIASKTVKRLEVLQRETKDPKIKAPIKPQKYLLALSRGASSTSMLHILSENSRQQAAKKQRPRFELLVLHVDTDLNRPAQSSSLLDGYKIKFPETAFVQTPLEDVLKLDTMDWSSLPARNEELPAPAQLADLLQRLPSTTSRADILRLFIRHLLMSVAVKESCDALLLGYNTTALAELTLSETAKGRGFSLPWHINDGAFSVPRRLDEPAVETQTKLPIYYPLREIFRKELVTYVSITSPPLMDVIADSLSAVDGKAAVVSHKDLSIEDVILRYFSEVEENYPSVVANVVRTTGKLTRAESENGRCGICGIGLDETGDERWRGELGEPVAECQDRAKLCYGCDRSIYG